MRSRQKTLSGKTKKNGKKYKLVMYSDRRWKVLQRGITEEEYKQYRKKMPPMVEIVPENFDVRKAKDFYQRLGALRAKETGR